MNSQMTKSKKDEDVVAVFREISRTTSSEKVETKKVEAHNPCTNVTGQSAESAKYYFWHNITINKNYPITTPHHQRLPHPSPFERWTTRVQALRYESTSSAFF